MPVFRPSSLVALAILVSLAGCGGDLDSTRRDAGPIVRADSGSGPEDDASVEGDAGMPARCEGVTPMPSSALAFDGENDQVSMGAAPALGLDTFTIEAWVRRDGRGIAAGTGVGGIQVVPIAGKGRGEDDGSNVDCNYAFGFVGDVIGADFEDMATGLNHPVVGRTAVAIGEWHHVAASYDGTTWRLYVDGALDGQASAGGATPRADSIQHFGIGTAFNSTGVAAGRLHGAIDELRVWDLARSDAELAGSMRETITSAPGLVARWALEAEEGGALDSVGGIDGTITGATFVSPGAVLDQGTPPTVTIVAPLAGEEIDDTDVELAIAIDDAEDDSFEVAFHVREITDEDDFTIVVLPDTQYYTVQANGFEHYFYDQTQWIVDNREAYDIVAVIHNGDLVDHGDRYEYEWTVADRAMDKIEVPIPGIFPDGIPWVVNVGNHDQTPNGTPGGTPSFNRWFGVERFASRAYYGGHRGSTNDDNWSTFRAGGLDFVVVSMQYDTTPDPAVLDWGRSIFLAHPGAFGIADSHYILGGTAAFGAQGRAIYDSVRDIDSVQLLTCGHVAGESRRTDTYEGNVIHSMLADYQGRTQGGSGWMRIWEFSPANDELTVRTYSPTLDRWETDDGSEFTLPVDLSGAGGAFEQIATIDRVGGSATTVLEGLEPGHVYEWYATVADCAQETRTPVARFTTRSP